MYKLQFLTYNPVELFAISLIIRVCSYFSQKRKKKKKTKKENIISLNTLSYHYWNKSVMYHTALLPIEKYYITLHIIYLEDIKEQTMLMQLPIH